MSNLYTRQRVTMRLQNTVGPVDLWVTEKPMRTWGNA